MISRPWLSVNVAEPFKASEIQRTVTIATHTTMAMEKLNMAARDAQARVNSIDLTSSRADPT